ncbi:MAG: hypothetical protein ABMB14_24835 [Myxococcota bacterium]
MSRTLSSWNPGFGEVLPVALVALVGCGQPAQTGVTWHQDVAPIVVERCSGCHQADGIGGFSLATYADAKPYAEVMQNALAAGTMPPFLAQETDSCTPPLPWQHDLRLSAEELALIDQWVEGGVLEGDPATAAPLDPPQPATLDGANLVLTLPSSIPVEGTTDLHTCLLLDPNVAADTYVLGRLITSGNDRILHHVVSYLVEPSWIDGVPQTKAELEAAVKAETGAGIGERYDCFGGTGLDTVETEMLDAWAPGGLPNYAPPDSGQPMPKDSLVLLDLHYHPSTTPEVDSATTLSLVVSDAVPEKISQIVLLGNFAERVDTEFGVGDLVQQPDEAAPAFAIPAGAASHVEEMTWTWTLPPGFDLSVYGVGTHMHLVGRDMRVSLEHPAPVGDEPADTCLIHTPSWNFNWQRGYGYDGPFEALPKMRNGDVLRMRCVYDNTAANPFLEDALVAQGLDAPVDVKLGEDTLDEMCLAAVAIVYPNYGR